MKAPTIEHNGEHYVQGFHWKDGWFFRRLQERGNGALRAGDVHVFHVPQPPAGPEPEMDVSFVIDANSWASIVASVSANGETGTTYGEALAFHMGGRYPHTVETAEAAYDHLKARIDRGPTPESEGC